MQRVDREPHLELTESPINPAFSHMSSPYSKYLWSIIWPQNKRRGALEMARIEMDPTRSLIRRSTEPV